MAGRGVRVRRGRLHNLQGWRLAVATIAAFAIPFGVAATAAYVTSGSSSDIAAQRVAILNYLDRAGTLASEGGLVVQQGMKPALNELQRKADDSTLVRHAAAWTRQFRQLRERWAQLPVPPALRSAHSEFLQALDGYIATGEAIAAVASRPSLIAAAVTAGQHADKLWNLAVAIARQQLVKRAIPVPSWIAVVTSRG